MLKVVLKDFYFNNDFRNQKSVCVCNLLSKKKKFHLVQFSFNSTFSDHLKSPWEKPINLVY